jgi:hypothetical protein
MMIEILFWVLLILWIVLRPWPGTPWATWPWPDYIIQFLLFVCLGLAVFGFGLHPVLR